MHNKLLLTSLLLALTACGGSGGSSQTPEPDNNEPELLVNYKTFPLEPKVFNVGASFGEENHFHPNDTISITWNMEIYYSDNTPISFEDEYIYDSSVYLSDDETIELDQDTKLFDIACFYPNEASSEYACGEFAHFKCKYAENNLNQASCTSIPLDQPNGIKDSVVDITGFLNIIPKTANVIIKSCLRDDPLVCVESAMPIQLN